MKKTTMSETTAQFYTPTYGKSYGASSKAKVKKEVIAGIKDGFAYFTTNPEKYVQYKEKYMNNSEYNWLWTGGGFTANPENHQTESVWKLDKYDNMMGEDKWVAYKIITPVKDLVIEG